MNYRRLGNSGMKISEVGLGAWMTFGETVGKDDATDLVAAAFDLGINFFDNANGYSSGRAEEVWGELLKDYNRDAFVLATKVFFPTGDAPTQRGLSRKHIFEQVEHSLRRLQTDHIDLYQCHRYDDQTPLEETVRAMDDLIKQGKVMYWGFSQWTPEQVRDCLSLCHDEGYYQPHGSQPIYNAIQKDWEDELLPLCHENGIGQVCFSPLAQGVLTGKYKPGKPFPGDSRAKDDEHNQFMQDLVEDNMLEKVQQLQPIAEEQGCTMAQLALAWCLRRPEVTSVIIGARKVSQLKENVEASGIQLDDDVVDQINAALA